jgi:hypothetical protein
MTAGELHDLMVLAGYSSRIRGEEVLVEVCWFCGNPKWNLELNPGKGVFSCWVCRESGRLDRLLTKTLGGGFSIPVDFETRQIADVASPTILDFKNVPAGDLQSASWYLKKRGFSSEDIRTYDIRVCLEEGHEMEGRLLFPLRDFWNSGLVGFVGRDYTGGFPKYRHTLVRKQICGYRTWHRSTPCLLVEGCLDGIAVHRAGFQAAVLLGTSSSELETFASRLPPETPLGIFLDGEAGDDATRLYWKLSPIRQVSAILLPSELDPAELHPRVIQSLVEKTF